MDRNKLSEELNKFCEECKNRGYSIIIEGLSEAYPGVIDTSYTVHIRVDDEWSNGLSCSDLLDNLLPILWDSTSLNARESIFSLDVYNVDNGINCHHLNTLTEFKLAC